jgi:hypothetical protein
MGGQKIPLGSSVYGVVFTAAPGDFRAKAKAPKGLKYSGFCFGRQIKGGNLFNGPSL